MTKPSKIDAVAEACIEAHELVNAHGTPIMKTLMRILLFEIGREIARREAESGEDLDGD